MKKSLLAVLFLVFSVLMAPQAGAYFIVPPSSTVSSDTYLDVKYVSPDNGYVSYLAFKKSVLDEAGLKSGQEVSYEQLQKIFEIEDRKEAEEAKMK